MKLIDTHTHIYLDEFDSDRTQIIERAKGSGISAVLLPNIDSDSVKMLAQLCDNEPEFAFPMMGLHPTSVNKLYVSELNQIEKALTQRTYYGIGEIGLDFYWDQTYVKEQKIVFEEQLRWSMDLCLPVSIHTRNAFVEVLESIYKIGADKLRGVFHCFTGGEAEWSEIQKIPQFKIGVNGVITFKKSHIPEILSQIPLEKILLETDAPYLAPSPYRGKRNEPAYLWETAKKMAEVYQIGVEEIAKQTFINASELFRVFAEGAE